MKKFVPHVFAPCFSALALLALTLSAQSGVHAQPTPEFPFQNPQLPLNQRVDDLLSRMTLDEKVSQMVFEAPGIERLHIAPYVWSNEALHGVGFAGVATVFPQAIGLAAAWNPQLHGEIASVISEEARAKYNDAIAHGNHGNHYGLTFWSPNINIFRDPRWGRGQETYGEDPFLTATLGVQFVKGMQGDNPRYLRTIATPKHFAVHSGPESGRGGFNSVVSDYDFFDTYLPAFQACVTRGHAQSVMSAYNAINGVPASANTRLLQNILREKWGFDGYVVTDCGAMTNIAGAHHYAKTTEEGVALGVKAGSDLACDGTRDALDRAVQQGLVSETDVNRAVRRLMLARLKLGMFDPPGTCPFDAIPFSENDSPVHRQLAARAARESLVLLKNTNGLLPLSPKIKSLAVIGPNADSVPALLGNYNGDTSHGVTVLEGLRKGAPGVRIEYVKGCSLVEGNDDLAPVPSTALRSAGQPGLRAEYFRNEDLTGTPEVTRQDPQVNFNWAQGNPVPSLPTNHVSARWSGELVAPTSGKYTVGVRGDDGYRLFVNGQQVIENWAVHPAQTQSITLNLTAGQPVPIRLEYYQGEGEAEIGLLWKKQDALAYTDAIAAAQRADAVVFVGGISAQLEGEEMSVAAPGFKGGDRTSLDLPDVQQRLLETLVATGKPVIMVMLNGSALSVNWASVHVPAILEAWYPGEEGGTAVADALFGRVNPAGRLPVTFYRSTDQLPAFTDYSMKGRTYRYFTGKPLYPFGYGLSYSRFAYSGLTLPRLIQDGQPVTISVQVQNVSNRAGDEVVELYLRPAPQAKTRLIASGQSMPRLVLAGFQRVPLAAHQRKTVSLTIAPDQLRLVNPKGERTLQPGEWQVYVGGQQPNLDIPSSQKGNGVLARLTVQTR